jgi:hypothetical protein
LSLRWGLQGKPIVALGLGEALGQGSALTVQLGFQLCDPGQAAFGFFGDAEPHLDGLFRRFPLGKLHRGAIQELHLLGLALQTIKLSRKLLGLGLPELVGGVPGPIPSQGVSESMKPGFLGGDFSGEGGSDWLQNKRFGTKHRPDPVPCQEVTFAFENLGPFAGHGRLEIRTPFFPPAKERRGIGVGLGSARSEGNPQAQAAGGTIEHIRPNA